MEDTEDVVDILCSECNDTLSADDTMKTDAGHAICSECVRICERCEWVATEDDDWNWVNDSRWCTTCTDYHANWCDSCEEYHTGDSTYIEDRDRHYCESCAEDAYYCEDCGSYYVDGCDSHNSDRIIHDYSYKPDPEFHGTEDNDKLFFGLEIEVEASGNLMESAEYAYRLEELGLAYLKKDGSLSYGFEIVTHPMTHDYFKNNAPAFWETLSTLRSSSDFKVKSWDTRTCGVHIHISRSGFNGGAHMHRFLNLVYSNQQFYEAIAGRSSAQWAKFDDVETAVKDGDRDDDGYQRWKTVRSFKNKLQNGRRSDRYSAVNTQNHATLEMRIFRGSVNGSTVQAYLDLAHASVEYTRELRVPDVQAGALQDVNLIEYIEQNADLYPDLCYRIAKVCPQLLAV